MTSDSGNNAFNSDTTSMTSPMKAGYDERDEAVFLHQQAEDAKIAIQQTLTTMQQTVKAAADVRVLTKQYPWIMLGATATTGFIAAALVLSATRSQDESPPAAAPASPKGSSLSSFVMSSFMGIARSAVMSAITSLVHANAQAESDAEQPVSYAHSDRNRSEGRRVPIS